jgi:alkyldihydroxyacetonephosphate synthase
VSAPTPPIVLAPAPADGRDRLRSPTVAVDDRLVRRLRDACASVSTEDETRDEAGRDWWPIAIHWALQGRVPSRPGAVARPASASEVAAVVAVCAEARVPVTPVAGRSGVCGASVPAFGGVSLDLCALAGVRDLDGASLVAEVLPGTFGPDLEASLRGQGVTLGHWPQSMDLSTVGGWLACRGAGQYSTRYGKIEDMVTGLEVVLADGSTLRTGGAPRAATGPDLTQLFVGSEGTLGVITAATVRLHPLPDAEARRAFTFGDFAAGLEACRTILRRGATPAVLRLYDEVESARNFDVTDACVLIVLDEAEDVVLDATMAIVDAEATAAGGEPADGGLVDRWLSHRNDVSALAPLYQGGIVVDTVEIAARWSALPRLYAECVETLRAVEGTLVASAHQSHAYTDGACLYFTFAGRAPTGAGGDASSTGAGGDASSTGAGGDASSTGAGGDWADDYYVRAWDAVTTAVMARGGAISHHHGIGLNRSRFMAGALGHGLDVLAAVKATLDPSGILNPGKLGLPSPFGEVLWP